MKPSQNSPLAGSSDEEMSLVDLWQMLCAGWRLMLGSLAVVLSAAGIYLAMTPSQYEATLVVKIGQVGMAEGTQQIEAPSDAIERMQRPGFENAVVESLGWKGDERERLFKYTYQVTSPTDKYLKIRLYAFSPDDARHAAEASLAMLTDIHRGLAEAIMAKRDQGFASLVADITDAETFLHRIEPLGKDISPNDHEQAVIWLQAVKDEKSRLRTLRMLENVMKESMKPEFTTPTMAIEPVIVSSQPVYPKAHRVWLFAAISGFLIGVLLVSLRSLILMNKKSRAPAA
jgi:hypothetical protein